MKLDSAKMRWHRDRLGWTLDTLAEQAEVAEGTALRAEHGEDIRPSSGRRIARALGVDISELVPDKPGVAPPKAPAPSSSGQPETEPPVEGKRTKEHRLLVLRRSEEAALEINRKIRADFESIEVATLKEPDPLIRLVAHAEWSYVGAKRYVRNDKDVLEAMSASPEERRAVDRVNTAITKLLVTAGDIAAALDSWTKSPVGTEDAAVTSLVEHVRRREVG